MATVISHYENILADRYTWLFGGLDANIAENKEFFLQNNLTPQGSGVAVDLGAGSGFQSIPLAQLGFSVTAIDLSEKLLLELAKNSPGLDIHTVIKDFTNLSADDISNVELLVCMGDTLTHLNARKEVQKLLKKIYIILGSLGRAVFSFRDLTHELKECDRFIPVRKDEGTIFTCFLEYESEIVKVHDLVYQRKGCDWEFKKSFYPKLRLSADWVEENLTNVGFNIVTKNTEKGWVTIIVGKQ